MNKNYNYYRISDYARYMNVSYECVRKWIIQNKVKTETIGGTVFVIEPKNEKQNERN